MSSCVQNTRVKNILYGKITNDVVVYSFIHLCLANVIEKYILLFSQNLIK